MPDEPADMPVNQPLTLEVKSPRFIDELPSMAERQRACEELMQHVVRGASLADKAMRRENLYQEC